MVRTTSRSVPTVETPNGGPRWGVSAAAAAVVMIQTPRGCAVTGGTVLSASGDAPAGFPAGRLYDGDTLRGPVGEGPNGATLLSLKLFGNFSQPPGVYQNRAQVQQPWEDSVGVATVYPMHQDVALDVELVERHRCGDLHAFDEVYGRFAEMVYNLSLRLAGNREEAADLTQEVFLRIYRHLGSFGGRSTLKTWVFRIAINHCRDRLSRHVPNMQSIDGDPEGGGVTLADPARGPEELAVAADQGRRVTEGLSRLPQVFREAVVLRDLEGLSYEEIAEVLGVRVGTVRSRIARGREHLRLLLEKGL